MKIYIINSVGRNDDGHCIREVLYEESYSSLISNHSIKKRIRLVLSTKRGRKYCEKKHEHS
jgi:hypothetical protein